MAFEFINKLPTPAEIKEQFPLPAEFVARKAERDEEVKRSSAEKVISSWYSSDRVPQIMRTQYWITPAA